MNGKEVDQPKVCVIHTAPGREKSIFSATHAISRDQYFVYGTNQLRGFGDPAWFSKLTAEQRVTYIEASQRGELWVDHLSPKKKAVLKLDIAPGFKLHRWLSSCCPRSFKENVLDELLASGTFMYQEALAEGDVSAAQRIRYMMRFWMLRAVFGGFITGAFSLLNQFRRKQSEAKKGPRGPFFLLVL